MERETDLALRARMVDTLARAASAGGSPHTFRAAFRVVSSTGTVAAETAGPLGTLRDPIARLIGDLGATDERGGRGGQTLLCTFDPYAEDLGVAFEHSSPAAAADTVVAAGITTVHVATPSASDFLEALRERGVDVRTEVCAGEAILMNEAPIVAERRGSPFVHLIAVESVDGRALSLEESPAKAVRLRADLGGGAGVATPGAAKNAWVAGAAELAKTISGTAWDRLTVITVPVVRGSGAEIVGDLRIREMANVRFLNNAAWWTRSDMVVLTGYRDVSETFGPALARAIGDTAPLPFGLHGVEPVRATGEGPAAVWPTGEQPSGEQSALRGGGVLAALGYHGQNSD